MEKSRITELVFILDRSGSMNGLESDTIGGFNSMLDKQKKEPGTAMVTTVLFDDQYEFLHDHLRLQDVKPVTDKDYYVRGCTALLDAIGRTESKVAERQRTAPEELRADSVLFVIITDGLENASREYRLDQIKRMIEQHRERDKWEFMFLGANIDAVETARSYGISECMAADYHADSVGTRVNFETISKAAMGMRFCGMVAPSCMDSVRADFESRRG